MTDPTAPAADLTDVERLVVAEAVARLDRKVTADREQIIDSLKSGAALAQLLDYNARPLLRAEAELSIWSQTLAGGWSAGYLAARQMVANTASSSDALSNGARDAAREAARNWLSANASTLAERLTAAQWAHGW